MNKASGKLAAGVRKMKTQQKPDVDATAAAHGETPAHAPVTSSQAVTTSQTVAAPQPVASPRPTPAQPLHPERVWPD